MNDIEKARIKSEIAAKAAEEEAAVRAKLEAIHDEELDDLRRAVGTFQTSRLIQILIRSNSEEAVRFGHLIGEPDTAERRAAALLAVADEINLRIPTSK